MLFSAFLQGTSPINELLTADYGYLSADLARWYDLPDRPEGFEQVQMASYHSGILTHGSILTTFAKADQSHPIARGKWMARTILCREPPPPPPDVDEFTEHPTEGLTKAEALEIHRQDAACAGCHMLMDPLGLALESFDPTGRFREFDEWGNPVDPSGELPDGQSFDDIVEIDQ